MRCHAVSRFSSIFIFKLYIKLTWKRLCLKKITTKLRKKYFHQNANSFFFYPYFVKWKYPCSSILLYVVIANNLLLLYFDSSYCSNQEMIFSNQRRLRNGQNMLHFLITCISLTHFNLVLHCQTPWKHQRNVRFSDVFRGYSNATLGSNGLNSMSAIFKF